MAVATLFKQVTEMTCNLRPTRARVGETVEVSGHLWSALVLPFKPITLYIVQPDGMQDVRELTTGVDGSYVANCFISQAGTWHFFVEYLGDWVYEGCTASASLEGTVGPEPPVPPGDGGVDLGTVGMVLLVVGGVALLAFFFMK